MNNLQSTKGQTKIIHEGYIYVKQKNLANGVISYECEGGGDGRGGGNVPMGGYDRGVECPGMR